MFKKNFFNNTKRKIVFFVVFVLAAGTALDAVKRKSRFTINIKSAHRQELTGKRLIAEGNVEISWEGYKIYADRLEFNRKTKELLAAGRVTMTSKETVITGEKFRFNLKKRTGEMYDTYGQLSPTVRYTTGKLNQVDKDTLTFKKLDFTTCSQCVPRWKITCANGKIKKEKYIEMKNILFKIKKIPVFYLPYLRYPIDKDGRSTGFLLPMTGNSSKKGFFIQNAFYWAIKPNVDLTLNFDYYSRAGIGAAQEFRYLYKKMDGNIKFYYFKYDKDFQVERDGSPGKSDYFLKMKHKQKIDLFKTNITVDIDRQSDPNFLRLLGTDFDNIQNRTSRSSVSITSSLSRLRLSISASQNDTYNTSTDVLSSIRHLPSIEANLNQQKIWKLPGYFSLSTSYSVRNQVNTDYAEETEDDPPDTADNTDIQSTGFVVTPSYTLSLIKSPWISANLVLKSSHNFYPRTRDAKAEDLVIKDESLYLHYQTAGLTLKGPVFSRIFESKTGKIKHLIEPKITFRYATGVDQAERNRLIFPRTFDYSAYSYVEFSLSTRLLYKGKKKQGSAREILSYTLKQEYYIDPVLANNNNTINNIYPEFSQLGNTLRVRPFKNFSIDGTLNYNHYLKDFTRILVTLSYNDKQSPLQGNFKYTKYLNQYKYNPGGTDADNAYYMSETIGGSLNFHMKGFPLAFKTRMDYDIENGRFQYRSFGLSYDYQCITFRGELKLFRVAGVLESQFNVGFSFGGLGMVKDLLGTK